MFALPRAPHAAVAGIVVVAATSRFAAATRFDVPWIVPDEAIYGVLGRAFWETGHMAVLDSGDTFYGLYPLLAGLPLALVGSHDGVTVVQLAQALLMSATAAIVYAWARDVTTAWWAVGAAALTAALPALAYSGLLMSEAAFLPVATLTLWALARAIQEPTLPKQAVMGGLLLLTVLTRLQGVVVFAVASSAIVIAALLGRDRSILRRFVPSFVAGAALALAVLAVAAASGDGIRGLLGAYADVASGGYEVGESLRWAVRHAADVYLLVLGLPLLALAVMLAAALRGSEEDPATRALLAVSTATVGWLVLEVGVFASRFVGQLAERDLIVAAPPLFVVLAVWLGRGMPRPQPVTSVAALVVVAPAVFLPVKELATPAATPDAFMLVPVVRLAERTSSHVVEAVWLTGIGAVILLGVLLPRRAAPGIVAAGVAALSAFSVFAVDEIASRSQADRRATFAETSPAWIDAAANDDVVYLYDGDPDWTGVWRHVFWNERIASVATPAGELPGPIPGRRTVVTPSADGVLSGAEGAPLGARWIVAPANVVLAGESIASTGQRAERGGLVLWQTPPIPRIETWTLGLRPNGDIVEPVRVWAFACGPGQLELTLLGKQGLPVRLSAGGRLINTVRLAPGEVWRGAVPTPADADGLGRCVFEIASDGLVGSTRIDFVSE